MKRLNRVATLSAVLAFAACGGGDAAPQADTEASPEPAAEPATPTTAGGQTLIEVDPAILPEGVTLAMVQEGQEVFNGPGICYTCHTQSGGGGPLAPDLTDDQWLNVDGEYASIIELVNTGVAQPREHPGAMLPRAGMPLTDDQVASVSAYVYALSRS
ncbi:MAG: c-type cytochrome [Gemmatimonadetes bacterium]|nr:c-type cytochrome [Gemmatimonadota bacterium]